MSRSPVQLGRSLCGIRKIRMGLGWNSVARRGARSSQPSSVVNSPCRRELCDPDGTAASPTGRHCPHRATGRLDQLPPSAGLGRWSIGSLIARRNATPHEGHYGHRGGGDRDRGDEASGHPPPSRPAHRPADHREAQRVDRRPTSHPASTATPTGARATAPTISRAASPESSTIGRSPSPCVWYTANQPRWTTARPHR